MWCNLSWWVNLLDCHSSPSLTLLCCGSVSWQLDTISNVLWRTQEHKRRHEKESASEWSSSIVPPQALNPHRPYWRQLWLPRQCLRAGGCEERAFCGMTLPGQTHFSERGHVRLIFQIISTFMSWSVCCLLPFDSKTFLLDQINIFEGHCQCGHT